MMEIKICKDVREYKDTIFFGLTLRQVICTIGACATAVGIYFGLNPLLGKEMTSWVCIVSAAPLAVAGFFHYNKMTAERFLWAIIKSFLNANLRLWKAENLYFKLK